MDYNYWNDTSSGGDNVEVAIIWDDGLSLSTLSPDQGLNLTSGGPGDEKVDNYCGAEWQTFRVAYGNIHGYTSLIVCVFGCIANLLNLIVLTRKGMISPTNAILTGLALADLLNMIEYIPFAFRMYIWPATKAERVTYGFAIFILLHSNFAQVTHTVSIWLTVTLAVWRYIAIGLPTRSVALCTMDRAKWAIAAAYFFSPLLCAPLFLSFSIKEFNHTNTDTNTTSTVFVFGFSELAKAHNSLLANLNFWIYSVVIKLIPCFALSLVSYRLIHALMEAKKRKQMLLSKRTVGIPGRVNDNNNESSSDRTTRMLLAVLILFLMTEFPQGILGLLSGILGGQFFESCYVALGELMDMVALLNSGINFILYCVMSKKFRETFWEVFHMDDFCKTFSLTRNTPKSNSAAPTISTTV